MSDDQHAQTHDTNGHGGVQVAPARAPRKAAPAYTGPAFATLAIEHQKAITGAVLDLLDVLVNTNGTAQRRLIELAADPAQPLAVRLLPAALAASTEARRAVLEMARSMTKGAK